MNHALRRLVPLTCLVAIVSAAVALAAPKPSATTGAATSVTSTGATLNGVVQSAGGPTTTYQFQYGMSTNYDKATPIQEVTPKNKAIPVSAAITGLSPGVTYHFRLVVSPGKNPAAFGADNSFTTLPIGNLVLLKTKLRVHRGFLAVPLACFSKLPCNGRFSIITRARLAKTGKIGNVGCATKFFRIPAASAATVKAKVRKACLSLLKKASHHRIRARYSSHPRTGQVGMIATVSLRLS